LQRIFSTLLHNGRLEIASIIRHTRLTPRQVKRGLAVLIQQHLVFHHSADSDSATAYEADWKGAYSLLRSGKIVQYTHDRFGKLAATAISRLLQLGHCRVRDIAKEVETSLKNGHNARVDKSLPNGLGQGQDHKHLTNGHNDESASKPHGVRETLQILAQHGFIRRMRPAYFRSPADNRVEAEKWVRIHKTFTKAKGPQLRLEIDQAVEVTLNEWYDGRIHDGQILNGTPLGSKRPRAEPDVGRGRKRGRLQNGVREIQDEEENESDLEPVSFSVSTGNIMIRTRKPNSYNRMTSLSASTMRNISSHSGMPH
jgi:DNA-directed RNA polymerase III subunit RPC3